MIRSSKRITFASFVVVLAALTICAGSATAQTTNVQPYADSNGNPEHESRTPTRISPWAPFKQFDTGYRSSLAFHPSSGLIVEAHAGNTSIHTSTGLYYHIGQFNASTQTITWGPSIRFKAVTADQYGTYPSVAITKEGYVIIVYTNGGSKQQGRLRYYVGTIDPNGGTQQQIAFKVQDEYYDTGWNSSISVNQSGVIAEAHEGDGSSNLFYRLGHLRAPASGDFSIVWDTGTGGKKYDGGIAPVISLNDNGDVVEVHEVGRNDHKLHYTRGKLSGNTIQFSNEHPRFEDYAILPSIALLNDGYVMEMHVRIVSGPFHDDYYDLTYRLGMLDRNSQSLIHWISQDIIARTIGRGGLAANADYAITTIGDGLLKSSWAIAP
jgi:hypothetical protein